MGTLRPKIKEPSSRDTLRRSHPSRRRSAALGLYELDCGDGVFAFMASSTPAVRAAAVAANRAFCDSTDLEWTWSPRGTSDAFPHLRTGPDDDDDDANVPLDRVARALVATTGVVAAVVSRPKASDDPPRARTARSPIFDGTALGGFVVEPRPERLRAVVLEHVDQISSGGA